MGVITRFLDWFAGVDVEAARARGARIRAKAAASRGACEDDDAGYADLGGGFNPGTGALMLDGGVFDADGEAWGMVDLDFD